MDDFVKIVSKKLENEFIFVDNDSSDDVDVIPTGSLSLDVCLGIGGIPKKRVTTIYGAEGAGKTTLCMELARSATAKGDRVLYIDVEQSIDYRYVKEIVSGINISNLTIAQPETAEEALTIAELGINGDPKLKLSGGQFSLIILDSVAALAPEKEKEKKLTDANISLTARTLGVFFRRNMYGIKQNNVALVLVNQVRDKINSYVGGYELPGGHALKHYSSVMVMLTRGTKIDYGDVTVGINSKFVITKNKLAPPFRSFFIPVIFGKGIDKYRDIIDFSNAIGVLKKRGAYFYIDDETLGQGTQKSIEYLQEHNNTLDKIVERCYNNLSLYTPDDEDSVVDELEE